jgi:hypothetical protein
MVYYMVADCSIGPWSKLIEQFCEYFRMKMMTAELSSKRTVLVDTIGK